jgi:multicomponent Na+:H+ antiporter subunit E
MSIVLYLSLVALWLLLAPQFELSSLLLGMFISLIIVIFTREKSETRISNLGRIIIAHVKFYWVLLIEILKANIDVAKIVLSKEMRIQPHYLNYQPHLKSAYASVLLANAITLTPGTLSVHLDEKGYVIHALTNSAAEGLVGSSLERVAKEIDACLLKR